MEMLMSRLPRFAAACALVAGIGCADGTGPDALPGLYLLTTVDGITLPVIIASDVDYTEEMLSGEVRLDEDGTFADITATRITSGGNVRIEIIEATGTYRLEGDQVVFELGNGGTYRMTHSRRTLTQDWFGFELLYAK
jgi:hypothetical protein